MGQPAGSPQGRLQGQAGTVRAGGVLAATVHRVEGTEALKSWRSRLILYLLCALMWTGLAILNFSHDSTGMGWVWVAFAAVNAALAVYSWSRLRRHHPVR